ncbi:unnamed protein product, partial [Closterium sp. NIES-65]
IPRATLFLGMNLERDREGRKLLLYQKKYIQRLQERFGTPDCTKAMTTPLSSLSEKEIDPEEELIQWGSKERAVKAYQSRVGSVMYPVSCTRVDVAHAASFLGQNVLQPEGPKWKEMQRTIAYLQQRGEEGLLYEGGEETMELIGYADASHASDKKDRKGAYGYVFLLGGTAITWQAKKLNDIALSSAEAEYMALFYACQEGVHFTNPKRRPDLIGSSGLYLTLAPSLRPMDASIMLTGPVAYEYLIPLKTFPNPCPSAPHLSPFQVHFTNPKARADLVDNSGLYLKLAPSLCPMDASIMLTGPVPYEVHFTNPKGRNDLIDNSGLYLKLAPTLRSMDASIMLTGPVAYEYLIRIPPAMPSWTQVSTCPGECTAAVFGNESVKIIGSVLHLHTLGRQVRPREDCYRGQVHWTVVSTCPGECTAKVFGNESVKIIGSVLHLHTLGRQVRHKRTVKGDFASQQTIPTTPEFELLPGDELRTSCVWDSTARTNVTLGGPSTEDEMCIDYLVYYPARQGQEMDMCYDMCASYENDTLGMDPNSPTLSKFYACGSNFIPTYQPCKITFGANVPMKFLNGCPAETQASLADIPSDTVSALLSSPATPAPAAALPPAAAASPPTAPGKAAQASSFNTLITPPASAIRLGIRTQVLASVSGPLVMCGSGETDGSAQLELVRRGLALFLTYKLTTQAGTRPSSKPHLLTAKPCPSSSSTTSTATAASLALDPALSAQLGSSLTANPLNATAGAAAGASASLLNTSAGVGATVGASLPNGTVDAAGGVSASTSLMGTSAGVGATIGASLPNGMVNTAGGVSASTALLNTSAGVGAGAVVSPPNGSVAAAGDLSASTALLNTSAGVGTTVGVSLPNGTVSGNGSLAASTGLLNTSAGVGATAGVSLPNGTVGATGGVAASTGLLNTSAGVGASIGASLPTGSASAAGGLSASSSLLNTSAGVGAGVGVSLPNGSLSGSASLGASSPLLNTSAGAGAAVNAGSGGINANLGASANLGGSVSGLISGVGGAVGSLVGSAGNMAGSVGKMGASVAVSLSPIAVLSGAWVGTSGGTYAMVGQTRVSAALASALVTRMSTNMPLFLQVRVGAQGTLVARME